MIALDDLSVLIAVTVILLAPHLVLRLGQRKHGRGSDGAGAELASPSPGQPTRRLAVVACMDTRLAVEAVLGLQPGDAHILRNAGGVASDDMLRSLILSRHLHGTREIIFLHHSDCALTHVRDRDLHRELAAATGQTPAHPVHFHAFRDQEENLRRQMRRVKSHPWLADLVNVRGFVYDVHSGALAEVWDDGTCLDDSSGNEASAPEVTA